MDNKYWWGGENVQCPIISPFNSFKMIKIEKAFTQEINDEFYMFTHTIMDYNE